MGQKVALVLSGGGARGIAHIGVIEKLEEEGFEISSIAGTSMGAVVGAVYGLGKIQDYKSWLYSLDKLKVFNLVDFTLSRQGFVKGDKVFKKMREFIPDGNIEDLNIPYAAIAADIIQKKEVVFTEGSIFDAIRASTSIPTVFTPVKSDHGLLVDGGVVNNIPIKHVKRVAGDILVVVNVNADIPVKKPLLPKREEEIKKSLYQKKVKEFYSYLQEIMHFGKDEKESNIEKKRPEEHLDFFNLINKTISSMTYTLAQMTLEKYSPDLLIQISHEACGLFDFYKAEEMVEMGKHATVETLKESKNYRKKLIDQ